MIKNGSNATPKNISYSVVRIVMEFFLKTGNMIKNIKNAIKKIVFYHVMITAIVLIFMGGGVVGIIAYCATKSISTDMRLDLVANNVEFSLPKSSKAKSLKLRNFASIALGNFERIKMDLVELEQADPKKLDLSSKQYQKNAWKTIQLSEIPVVIRKGRITIKPLNESMTMQPWRIEPNHRVKLSTNQTDKTLSIKVENQLKETSISLVGGTHFEFTTDNKSLFNLEIPYQQASSPTLRGKKLKENRIEIFWAQNSTLDLTLETTPDDPIFMTKNFFEIEGIKFDWKYSKLNPPYPPETGLVKEGTISYPQYPKIDKVLINHVDFIDSDPKNKFLVEKMALVPEGIAILLRGEIDKKIATYPFNFSQKKDHRLTWYDTFTENKFGEILFNFFVWWIPVVLGMFMVIPAYKKECKNGEDTKHDKETKHD